MKRAVVLAIGVAMALAAGASAHTGTGVHHHRPPGKQRPVTLQWVGDIALSTQRGLPSRWRCPGARAGRAAAARRAADAWQPRGHAVEWRNLQVRSGLDWRWDVLCFQAPPSTAHGCAGLASVGQSGQQSLRGLRTVGACADADALRAAGIAYTGLPGEITRLTVGGVHFVLGFAPTAMTPTCSIFRLRRRWCAARGAAPRS